MVKRHTGRYCSFRRNAGTDDHTVLLCGGRPRCPGTTSDYMPGAASLGSLCGRTRAGACGGPLVLAKRRRSSSQHPRPTLQLSLPSSALMHLARPLLLVSDLDDTLIGHASADALTAGFTQVWQRSKDAGVRCALAINTGRTLPLWELAWQLKQHCLAQPDVLIAGCGSRIYWRDPQGGGWVEDAEWTAHMNEGWDVDGARAVMDGVIAAFGAHRVTYQAAAECHEHKLTVLYDAALQGALVGHLEASLAAKGLAALIIEGACLGQPGLRFVDMVPKNAGKGAGMHFVRQRLGYDTASVVACGDSWNDLHMLQRAHMAIVVGNGVPDVRTWAVEEQQRRRQLQLQKQQQNAMASDPSVEGYVYLANEPCAAGVLEGLRALGFLHPHHRDS